MNTDKGNADENHQRAPTRRMVFHSSVLICVNLWLKLVLAGQKPGCAHDQAPGLLVAEKNVAVRSDWHVSDEGIADDEIKP